MMFVHLGGEVLVRTREIVAIINSENSLGAQSTREFLKTAREKGLIQEVGHNNFKSIVITGRTVYLSPISALTLKKRSGFISELK
jgi:EAL domain-containing protein (putative c-di-GMP-specific phosphodiesterase class I)